MKTINQDFNDLVESKKSYIKHNSINIMKLENIIECVLTDKNMENKTKNMVYYYLREEYLKAIWKRQKIEKEV